MNSVSILNITSIICFSVSGVLLIIGIILFIKFDVIGIINDLRGKKAQKQIEKIRENYSKASRIRYNIDSNGSSEEITEDIEKTDEIVDKTTKKSDSSISKDSITEGNYSSVDADKDMEISLEETDLLQDEELQGTEVLTDELAEGTEVLTDELECGTDVLSEGTAVLMSNYSDVLEETTLLESSDEDTSLLQEEDDNSDFRMIKNIISINTNEYI